MNLLYFKGATIDSNELNSICHSFEKENMNLILTYNSYANLPFNHHKLKKDLSERISFLCGDANEVNLICHSIGCNLGVFLAGFDNRINKLVLISPEFVVPSDTERIKIQENYHGNDKFLSNILSINCAKEFKPFLSTQAQTRKLISKIDNDILLLYGMGDTMISQNYFRKLEKRKNISCLGISTSSHNPLIDNPSKTLSLIKAFMR